MQYFFKIQKNELSITKIAQVLTKTQAITKVVLIFIHVRHKRLDLASIFLPVLRFNTC